MWEAQRFVHWVCQICGLNEPRAELHHSETDWHPCHRTGADSVNPQLQRVLTSPPLDLLQGQNRDRITGRSGTRYGYIRPLHTCTADRAAPRSSLAYYYIIKCLLTLYRITYDIFCLRNSSVFHSIHFTNLALLCATTQQSCRQAGVRHPYVRPQKPFFSKTIMQINVKFCEQVPGNHTYFDFRSCTTFFSFPVGLEIFFPYCPNVISSKITQQILYPPSYLHQNILKEFVQFQILHFCILLRSMYLVYTGLGQLAVKC